MSLRWVPCILSSRSRTCLTIFSPAVKISLPSWHLISWSKGKVLRALTRQASRTLATMMNRSSISNSPQVTMPLLEMVFSETQSRIGQTTMSSPHQTQIQILFRDPKSLTTSRKLSRAKQRYVAHRTEMDPFDRVKWDTWRLSIASAHLSALINLALSRAPLISCNPKASNVILQ